VCDDPQERIEWCGVRIDEANPKEIKMHRTRKMSSSKLLGRTDVEEDSVVPLLSTPKLGRQGLGRYKELRIRVALVDVVAHHVILPHADRSE
jgi:hypothetical protein